MFYFCGSGDHHALHSFPTRRSSDLGTTRTSARQRGTTSHLTGSNPSDRNASISSDTFIVAISEASPAPDLRSEEHTSELQSQSNLVCRLLLEKKNTPIVLVRNPRSR